MVTYKPIYFPEQSDWCNNMPIHLLCLGMRLLCNYHVLEVVFIHGTLSCSAHAIKSQNPSSQQIPLFSGAEGGEGERVPGTHCLHMRLIAMELCGDHVHTCMYVCIVVMS